MNIPDLIAEASRLRLSDDFVSAQSICMDILGHDSSNAEAMCLMGICLIEGGDMEAGPAWLDRAEIINPELAVLQLYRSVQWEMLGDQMKAVEAARKAAELDSSRFDVWGRLGDLSGRLGRFEEAAQALSKALEIDPAHPSSGNIALRLSGALIESGDLAATSEALALAESKGLKGHPEIHRLKAAIARQKGQWDEMEIYCKAWWEADREDEEARGAYALALGQLGFYKKATEIFRPVAEAQPYKAVNWASLARFKLGARDIDGAKVCLEKALALDPNCPEATYAMARVHNIFGEFEYAENMCRKTLHNDPSSLEAYGLLCEVSAGNLSNEELECLIAETGKSNTPADKLSIGLFALGDAHHKRKRHAEAFIAWQRANETKKIQHGDQAVSDYDKLKQEDKTSDLTGFFAKDSGDVQSVSLGSPIPIFIIGMPRSGTTLIENAISAHEDVVGGGELPAMPYILDEFLGWARETNWKGDDVPDEALSKWRQKYLSQFVEFGLLGAKYVTDKQPSNFLAVGLIRKLFPEAHIIHIRRRPLETAFSIFRRNFSRMWPFAHDLDTIAHYYAEHAKICAHWESQIQYKYTTIQYEDFVKSFEDKLRFVLSRVGLTWSRECLTFYNQKRSVLTFSSSQVRKPPSVEHLNSTTPYMEQLSHFDATVNHLGVDTVTGKWMTHDCKDFQGQASTPKTSGGLLGLVSSMLGASKLD